MQNYNHDRLLARDMLYIKRINSKTHPDKDRSMGKKRFDFWQDHSSNYLEMAFGYDRRERIHNPDGYGKRTGECGDTVEMFLTIRDERIQSVCFDTNGCINTNACCNSVACLTEGKKLEEAWEITSEDVIGYLRTLQPENYHCAELAVGALYLALTNYQEQCRTSWKKPYRKHIQE
jgi:nitrogen fixation NifU-like protein